MAESFNTRKAHLVKTFGSSTISGKISWIVPIISLNVIILIFWKKYNVGVVTGTALAAAFNPWDRALYLACKSRFQISYILWITYSVTEINQSFMNYFPNVIVNNSPFQWSTIVHSLRWIIFAIPTRFYFCFFVCFLIYNYWIAYFRYGRRFIVFYILLIVLGTYFGYFIVMHK